MKLTKKDADDVTEFFMKLLIYFLAIAMLQAGLAFALFTLPSVYVLFPSFLFAWGIALFEMGIRFIYRRGEEEPEEKKGGGVNG